MSKSNDLHMDDDVDIDPNAHHHTLGNSPNQAAPGNAGFYPGDLKVTASSVTQQGWLTTNGALQKRVTRARLFAAIGTVFNTGGEAADEFRIPNIAGPAAGLKYVIKT